MEYTTTYKYVSNKAEQPDPDRRIYKLVRYEDGERRAVVAIVANVGVLVDNGLLVDTLDAPHTRNFYAVVLSDDVAEDGATSCRVYYSIEDAKNAAKRRFNWEV